MLSDSSLFDSVLDSIKSYIPLFYNYPPTLAPITTIIIIMYIYLALINTLSAHMIHIDLNMIFYTHVEHGPKTMYIKYHTHTHARTHARTHTHTHTHTQ